MSPLTVGDHLVGGLDDVREDDVLAAKVLPEELGQPSAQLAQAAFIEKQDEKCV